MRTRGFSEEIIRKLNQQIYLALEPDDCSLEQAQYDLSLSQANFEKDAQLFWASLDFAQNKSILELVKKILVAHGYDLNIENMLATLDSLWLGNLVAVKSEKSLSAMVAKKFLPSISFYMPSKGKPGFLLDLFYEEIGAREGLDDSAKTNHSEQIEKKNELIAQQKGQIKQLEAKVQMLELMLKKVPEQGKVQISESNHFRDAEIKVGTLYKVDFAERAVVIKSGRQHFRVPFYRLQFLPQEQSRCVFRVDGKKSGVDILFCDLSPLSFEHFFARVQAMQDGSLLKLSLGSRGRWQVLLKEDEELELSKKIAVGSELVVSMVGEHIINFQILSRRSNDVCDPVQEAVVKFQLEQVETKEQVKAENNYDDLKEQ